MTASTTTWRTAPPGEDCAEAFIHYPHAADAPVQQEHAQMCGVDLSQWHNIAVEWTPDHVKEGRHRIEAASSASGASA